MENKPINYSKLAKGLQRNLAKGRVPLGEHIATVLKVSQTPYHPVNFDLKHKIVETFQKDNGLVDAELFQLLSYLARNNLISLLEVAESRYTRMFFETSVETFIKIGDAKTVFIIREFDNALTMKVYDSSIKPSIKKLKLEPLMLEDKEHSKAANLNNYIKSSIKDSLVVVCDITFKSDLKNIKWNPNVFFEAGMADGFDKTIIYIANQKIKSVISKLPFDMSSHTVFFYDPNALDELSAYLERQIKSIIKNND